MKNQKSGQNQPPTKGQNGQRESEAFVRREMKKLSPKARLSKDVAAEQECDRVRLRVTTPRPVKEMIEAGARRVGLSLDEWCEHAVLRQLVGAESPNVPARGPAHHQRRENGMISLVAPGLLSGMEFAKGAILEFLSRTIHGLAPSIEGAIQAFAQVARRAGAEPHDVTLLLASWREVALFAREFTNGQAEFRNGLGMFTSPLSGLLSAHLFSEEDLLCMFCEFLHDQRDALSDLLRREQEAGRPHLSLAEALVIAESVAHENGLATEYDSGTGQGTTLARPTALQKQMWELRVASIESQYNPEELAA